MPASIEQFKGIVSAKGGLARSNLWRITLPSLPGATTRDINLLCKDVQIPGRQVLTQERQYGIKQTKVPYGFAHEDVSLTFHVMNDYGIHRYFDVWQNLAVQHRPGTAYEVNYKSTYAFDISLTMLKKGFSLPIYSTPLGIPRLPPEIQNRLPRIGPFDLAQGEFDLDFTTQDLELAKVTLFNAYCTTMNGITLNNDAGGLIELNVQLSFDNYDVVYYQQTSSIADTLMASVIGGLAARL